MAYIDEVRARNQQLEQQNRAMQSQSRDNLRTLFQSVAQIGLDVANQSSTEEANIIGKAEAEYMTANLDEMGMKNGDFIYDPSEISSRYGELHEQFLAEYTKNHKISALGRAKYNSTYEKYKDLNSLTYTTQIQQKRKEAIKTSATNYVTTDLVTADFSNSESQMERIIKENQNYNEILGSSQYLQMLDVQYRNELASLQMSDEEAKANGIDKTQISTAVTAKKIDAYLRLINAGYDSINAEILVNKYAFEYASEEFYGITRERALAFSNMQEDGEGHTWNEESLTKTLAEDISTISQKGLAGYGKLTESQIQQLRTNTTNQITEAKSQWNKNNTVNYVNMQISLQSKENSIQDDVSYRFYDMETFEEFVRSSGVDINWMKQFKSDDYLAYNSKIINNSTYKAIYDASELLARQSSYLSDDENKELAIKAESILAENPNARATILTLYGDIMDPKDNVRINFTLQETMNSMNTLSGISTSGETIDSKVTNVVTQNYNSAVIKLKGLKNDPNSKLDNEQILDSLSKEFNIRKDSSQYSSLKSLVESEIADINVAVTNATRSSFVSNYMADNFTSKGLTMKPSDVPALFAKYNSDHPDDIIKKGDVFYTKIEDEINTAYATDLGNSQKATDLLNFVKEYYKYMMENNGASSGFDVNGTLKKYPSLSLDDVSKYATSVNSSEFSVTQSNDMFDFNNRYLTYIKEHGSAEGFDVLSAIEGTSLNKEDVLKYQTSVMNAEIDREKAEALLNFENEYYKYVEANGSADGFDVTSILANYSNLTLSDVQKYTSLSSNDKLNNILSERRYTFLESISEKDSKDTILSKAKEIGLSPDDQAVSSAINNSQAYAKLQKKESSKTNLTKFIEDSYASNATVTYKDIMAKGFELELTENEIWDSVAGMSNYYRDSVFTDMATGIQSNIDSINSMSDNDFSVFYQSLNVAEKSAINILMKSSNGDKKIDLSNYEGLEIDIIKGLLSRDYIKSSNSAEDVENGVGTVNNGANTPASRFIGDMMMKEANQIVISMFALDPKLSTEYPSVITNYLANIKSEISGKLPQYVGEWNDLDYVSKENVIEVASKFGITITLEDINEFANKSSFKIDDLAEYICDRHMNEQIFSANSDYKQYGSVYYGIGVETINDYISDRIEISKYNANLEYAYSYIQRNNGHVGDTIPSMDGFKWPRSMELEAKQNYTDALCELMSMNPKDRKNALSKFDSFSIESKDWEMLENIVDGDLSAVLDKLNIQGYDLRAIINGKLKSAGNTNFSNDEVYVNLVANAQEEIITELVNGNIKENSIQQFIENIADDVASKYAWNSAIGGGAKYALNSYDNFKTYDMFTYVNGKARSEQEIMSVFEGFSKAVSGNSKEYLYEFQGGINPNCYNTVESIVNGLGNYETTSGTQTGPIYNMAYLLFGTDETKTIAGMNFSDKDKIENKMALSLALAMQTNGYPCEISGDDFNSDKRNLTLSRVYDNLNGLPSDIKAGVLYSAMQVYTLSHNQSVMIGSDLPMDFTKGFSITSDGTFKNQNGDIISFDKNGSMNVTYKDKKVNLPSNVFGIESSAQDILISIDKSLSGYNLSWNSGFGAKWTSHTDELSKAINEANAIRYDLNQKGYNVPYITIQEVKTESRIGKMSTGYCITTTNEIPSSDDPAIKYYNETLCASQNSTLFNTYFSATRPIQSRYGNTGR